MGILIGIDVMVVILVGYEFNVGVLMDVVKVGVEVYLINDLDVIQGVDVLYIDVWILMGQEVEVDICCWVFRGYQVMLEMLEIILFDGIFLYCLFVYYGEEIVLEVIEYFKSCVFDQVENCLYV